MDIRSITSPPHERDVTSDKRRSGFLRIEYLELLALFYVIIKHYYSIKLELNTAVVNTTMHYMIYYKGESTLKYKMLVFCELFAVVKINRL